MRGGRRAPAVANIAGMSATLAARTLSIVGHPGVLMPVAVAIGAAGSNAPAQRVHAAVAAAVLVAVIAGAFSLWQVGTGRWSHVDASHPRERGQLNAFLAGLLFSAAALLAWWGEARHGAAGAASAGALVAVAHLLRRWLKVSLHTAFAVFAAAVAWPSAAATLLILGLAAGVAWSRLALQRHTLAEVAVGLLLGAAAGVSFKLVAG
jgi:phosphotransferase system  glucose/maltose/N-acetylglucosamine-specific IIC component